MRASNSSILVTGCPRSGTTWVGSTLGHSSWILPIFEPFNSRAPYNLDLEQRYLHLGAHNENRYRDVIEGLMSLSSAATRFRYAAQAATSRRPLLGSGMQKFALRSLVRTPAAFVRGKRLCLKDPIAFFAAEWLSETYDARVIVLVRHPAGVVSSNLRLGWAPDIEPLISQPTILNQFLEPLAEDIDRYRRGPGDPLQGHILMWKIFAQTALQLRVQHPDWLFVRHEDLCLSPLDGFQSIASFAGVPWTRSLRRKVEQDTSSQNKVEPTLVKQHSLKRASRDLPEIWRSRLPAATQTRIENETGDLWEALSSSIGPPRADH